jgi:hypothetical protein
MYNNKRTIKSIVIDMTSDDHTIKVSNDAGDCHELNNVLVIGGNTKDNRLYIFAEGRPEAVADSLSGTFKWSRDDASKTDKSKTFFRVVFMSFLKWLVTNLGIPMERQGQLISGEELLARWEKEDKERKEKEKTKRWN